MKLTKRRRRLAERYIPLAINIANRWRKRLRISPDVHLWGDLMGAAFLGLCQAANSYEDRGIHFSICARPRINGEVLNELQRHRRQQHEPLHADPTAPDESGTSDVPNGVMEALRGLSARDQELIERSVWRGEPFSAIAADIGLTEDGAAKATARAIARLRATFAGNGRCNLAGGFTYH